MKKFIILLMLFVCSLTLSSCIFDEWGKDIADNVVGKFTDEFKSELNSPTP